MAHRQEGAVGVERRQLEQRRVEAPAGPAPGHKKVCNDQLVRRHLLQERLRRGHPQEVRRRGALVPTCTCWGFQGMRKLGLARQAVWINVEFATGQSQRFSSQGAHHLICRAICACSRVSSRLEAQKQHCQWGVGKQSTQKHF